MKGNSYVGPVTSLAFWGEDLLAGHGSHLKRFSPSGTQFALRWRRRIFQRERIQGIEFSNSGPRGDADGTAPATQVLLWGGKRFQIVPQSVLDHAEPSINCEDEIPAPDWILHAAFLHPATEDKTVEIAVITAHNTILRYRHDLDTPIAQRFRFYPSPERCLLYSAHITVNRQIPGSDSLVALAGTVFGEVLLWEIDTSQLGDAVKPNLIARYLSHEGSVFGVSVSQDLKLAASCSDDRTIRVWDVQSTAGGNQVDGCQEVKEPLAVGWGHQARIWGTRFLESGDKCVKLISFSEDLTAKIWSFDGTSSPKSLVCVQTFKSLHSASGKNIWSLAVHPDGDMFVTGGADSGIASWEIAHKAIDGLPRQANTLITETVFPLAGTIQPLDPASSKRAPKDEPRKYVTLGANSFLAIMSSGWLRHCQLSNPVGEQWRDVGFWPQIKNSSAFSVGKAYCEGTFTYLVALGANDGKFMFLRCDSSGPDAASIDSSQWIKICDSRPSEIIFDGNQDPYNSIGTYAAVTTFRPDDPVKLLYLETTDGKPALKKQWPLVPPETFPFTTILVHQSKGRIICLVGSRHGAFALYEIPEESDAGELKPVKVWRHVHDDESVTSLACQNGQSATRSPLTTFAQLDIVSTGRSGAYKFHRLSIGDSEGLPQYDLSERNVVYPASVPRLENYQVLEKPGVRQQSEILYGFRGRDFVLWNQTLGIEAASFDCEGGNRSWAFTFGDDNDSPQDHGLFVFTKSKECHVVRFENILHNPLIQAPFHGRELKALAVSPKSTTSPYRIIATGAEDTTIRFSYVHPETDELHPLTLRKSHTTGIQELVWSPCGGWLFSSGSIEEVYCWKVNHQVQDIIDTPVTADSGSLAIGVVREAVYAGDADTLPDLRVCGLDVATVMGAGGDTLGFLVGMVRSDSSIRLAFYDIAAKRFLTIAEGVYKSNCLLQIRFSIANDAVLMFTAGTIWDVTGVLAACGITGRSKALSIDERLVVPTSGPVRFLAEKEGVQSLSLHQNSVKVLVLVETEGGEIILLTGGDDTAIVVSRVKLADKNDSGKLQWAVLKSIERSHASAVTTITAMPPSATEGTLEFVSSGVDQQVKRWKVTLAGNGESPMEPETTVECLEDVYVNVPDVAATALVSEPDGEEMRVCKLVVGGVGMEVLEL
ncbi:hypothetical protein DRE_06582 [Drechslerella stenobrocha 248]|uniref:Uncharacterized protein n=1 Tax=Drechslerella stenobrocha 248 TaxID=1043628 RepID=W7HL25_9PEZI|nr:hypothetical protein DRE_06582 [Drechslerella stenobrocha 248]